MKKGSALLLAVVFCVMVLSTASKAADDSCEYSKLFDKDRDFIMSNSADCGSDYTYDCNDNDPDVFKECKISFWGRILDFFTKERDVDNKISGRAITQIIKTNVDPVLKTINSDECEVNICLNSESGEVYCPLSLDKCENKYTDCRIIRCETEENTQFATQYETDTSLETEEGQETSEEDDYTGDVCSEEYNECIDGGEEIICKGSFEACSTSFESCSCGTGQDVSEQAVPDLNTENNLACDTGVFVCERQVITMSGEVAESKVTCKSSFQECSTIYGNCQCGNSTLIEFPVQYVGSACVGDENNSSEYWCDYKGKNIPCYMLPENCNKKKNTCEKDNGVWVTCEGSFDYCNKKFAGNCLCGVEILTSGFMTTSAD